MNEPRAMREIHEIRERIYIETENMSAEERAAYYHNALKLPENSGYAFVPTGRGTYRIKKIKARS